MANGNEGHGAGNPGHGGGNDEVTIHIDKKQYKSPSPTTGSALYLLSQVAAGYDLWREAHGQGDDEQIANNATQVVLKNGDHFYTAQSFRGRAVTVTDVKELLPEADRDFLSAAGYDHTIERVGQQVHIVIRNFPLPRYKPQSADLLIIVPSGYPNAKLDMFWTFPDVFLPNGGIPLKADVHEQHGERNWQRWSRHIADGKWRPGVDNLRSYMTTVKSELAKGL